MPSSRPGETSCKPSPFAPPFLCPSLSLLPPLFLTDISYTYSDSANNYQNEESERFIGEWMKERGNRDRLVIATKYTTNYRSYELREDGHESIAYSGNSKKSLHLSLRDSLAKLGTDYVDILCESPS